MKKNKKQKSDFLGTLRLPISKKSVVVYKPKKGAGSYNRYQLKLDVING